MSRAVQIKRWARRSIERTVEAVTGRHVVLLPKEADGGDLLTVRAPYRVEGSKVRIVVADECSGTLRVDVLGYRGHFPVITLHSASADYRGSSDVVLDLDAASLTFGDAAPTRFDLAERPRRFAIRFTLNAGGDVTTRLTSHYVAGVPRSIGADYYSGDTYVDHEAQSVGEHAEVLRLIREHGGEGPLLEVGCATGGLIERALASGIDAYGVDISDWAVEQAAVRVGGERVRACDVERDGVPDSIREAGPFGVLVLWAVLEHFQHPARVLEDLAGFAAPGALLLINTSNADSLAHVLFGRDWEGHFDWSHHGVEEVSVRFLRERLPALGWEIEAMDTRLIWDACADPTHATLRDWHGADARFRALLAETERGDFITCVARKR